MGEVPTKYLLWDWRGEHQGERQRASGTLMVNIKGRERASGTLMVNSMAQDMVSQVQCCCLFGWMVLCHGHRPVYCRMFNSILDISPPMPVALLSSFMITKVSPDSDKCPSKGKNTPLRATWLSSWKNVTGSVYLNLNDVRARVFSKSSLACSILSRISAEGCHSTNRDGILAEAMFLLLLRKSVDHLVKKYVLALTVYNVLC